MLTEPGHHPCCQKEELSKALLDAATVLAALKRGEDPMPRISLEAAPTYWNGAREGVLQARGHGC